jgi:hypothetical protein
MGKEPPKGGDGSVGYLWAILIFNLIFLACMVVVALSIGAKGGFDWVSADKGTRFWFVAIGLVAAMITSALSGFFKGEPGPTAAVIQSFSGFFPWLILIAIGAILLNDGLRMAVPVQVYKIPLMFVFGIGVSGLGAAMIGWMIHSGQNTARRAESLQADQAFLFARYSSGCKACLQAENRTCTACFFAGSRDGQLFSLAGKSAGRRLYFIRVLWPGALQAFVDIEKY